VRILTLSKKDISNIKKDKMMIFMFLVPLVIAFAVRFIMPSINTGTTKVFVSKNLPEEYEKKLSSYFEVIKTTDRKNLENSVMAFSDIPGIDFENNGLEVVLQGNEEPAIINMLNAVIIDIEKGTSQVSATDIGAKKSGISELIISMILIFVISISGVLGGFTMVDDKESKMINALAVSPIRLSDYIASKVIVAVSYSIIVSFISQLIMTGLQFNIKNYFLIILSGMLLSLTVGFIIGTLADTQNMAIAYTKIVTFLLVFVPMLSLILPASVQWIFGVIPSYWTFKIIWQLYLGIEGNIILSSVISVVYNTFLLVLLVSKLKRKIGLRLG
jgi:ABC-2 type transport system permease protein